MLSAERRRDTWLVIKRRLKQLKIAYNCGCFFYGEENFEQPHRLSKKTPFGCSRSHCLMCHHDKFDDRIPETMV
jgi:hypothetical protein